MLLAIDVGNTNIVFGLFDGEVLRESWRLTTDRGKTADEYGVFLRSLFDSSDTLPRDVTSVILASVVPPLTPIMRRLVDRMFHLQPMLVSTALHTGISWDVESPAEMGADRVADCVGAFMKYGGPCVVVDLGTATTFNYVSGDGRYLGGSIAPGLLNSSESLFSRTAKLPRIELERPTTSLGVDTVTQMQIGVVWGEVFMVDGMIERMRHDSGLLDAKVVVTGGLATVVVPGLHAQCIHDPTLTLDGLRILFELNRDGST
ncbi:MAG: type III pantothenate kinase [Candidatus Cryosericum sp.]|nr:type III pantothenate kinase [Candidatus Cryosericum sp.]HPS69410.1 type III pantothenate kinase [Candidatus Cryosericum sp.]